MNALVCQCELGKRSQCFRWVSTIPSEYIEYQSPVQELGSGKRLVYSIHLIGEVLDLSQGLVSDLRTWKKNKLV